LPAATWPDERLAKARRNYSMDYIATILPEAVRLFGPLEGGHLAGAAARMTGMQYYAETAALVGTETDRDPRAFAEYLVRMGRGQGDDTTWEAGAGGVVIRQTTWRLMDDAGALSSAVFEAWTELWRGAALAHDPRATLEVAGRRDRGDACFEWRLR
jgi:hypothetical protein